MGVPMLWVNLCIPMLWVTVTLTDNSVKGTRNPQAAVLLYAHPHTLNLCYYP